MKEVEIIIKVHKGARTLEKKLRKIAKFVGAVQVDDQYYHDPLRHTDYFREDGRFARSFRLRNKDAKVRVTHKRDYFDAKGLWTYSDELETDIGDHKTFKKLIEALGYKKLVRLQIVKKTFLTAKYEIVLEDAKGLGTFLEVEALQVPRGTNIEKLKDEMRTFAKNLGIEGEEELLRGKAELLYLKQKGK